MSYNYNKSEQDALLMLLQGRRIEEVYVRTDAEEIAFALEGVSKFVTIMVYGDCCSMSFWHEVLGFSALAGTVNDVEYTDLGVAPDSNVPGQWDGEYVQAYSLKITTMRGVAEFIFRNDSNGYYGGSPSMPTTVEALKQADWKPVTGDGQLW